MVKGLISSPTIRIPAKSWKNVILSNVVWFCAVLAMAAYIFSFEPEVKRYPVYLYPFDIKIDATAQSTDIQ